MLLILFAEFAAAIARNVLAVDFLLGAGALPVPISRLKLGLDDLGTVTRSRSTRRKKGLGRFSSSDGSYSGACDLRATLAEVVVVDEEEDLVEDLVVVVSRLGAEAEAGMEGRPLLRMEGRRSRVELVVLVAAVACVFAVLVFVPEADVIEAEEALLGTSAPPNLRDARLLVREGAFEVILLIRRALTFFDGEFASTKASIFSRSEEEDELDRVATSTVVSLSSRSASSSSVSDLSSLSESKSNILRKLSPTRGDSRIILARSALASATGRLKGAGVFSVSPVWVNTTPRIADPGIPGDSLNGLGVSNEHCVAFRVIALRGVSS